MLYCVYSNRKGAITMAIGERIRFIRNLRGMTQKILGTAAGFPEKIPGLDFPGPDFV